RPLYYTEEHSVLFCSDPFSLSLLKHCQKRKLKIKTFIVKRKLKILALRHTRSSLCSLFSFLKRIKFPSHEEIKKKALIFISLSLSLCDGWFNRSERDGGRRRS